MTDEIYFLNTPVEIQEKIYNDIVEKLSNLEIDNNNIVYLRQVSSINFSDNYYFEVYVRPNIVDHKTLISPEFLIFLK
jgi:hypothetical protein